jgi:hypothetical protein
MVGIRGWIIASASTALVLLTLNGPARAQGVAFQPSVGVLPVGPSLGVTPSVSIDRRYVRLGINVQFIDNASFFTYQVPAAVGGGPGGPGALSGVGGIGGITGGRPGGGGVGGNAVGGGGAVGGQFLAGMNGVIDPSQMAGPAGSGYGYGYGSGYPSGSGFRPGRPPAQPHAQAGSDLDQLAAMNAAAHAQQVNRATPSRVKSSKAVRRPSPSRTKAKARSTTAAKP